MAANAYHGADGTISIQTMGGTSMTIGGLRGLNIVPGVEIDDLYTADSIERDDTKQRQLGVLVEATLVKLDVAFAQQWLGGSGSSSTKMKDTTDPALFQVTGQVTPSGGGTVKKAIVDEVRFPEFPLFANISYDAWEETQLSGRGKNLTFTGP